MVYLLTQETEQPKKKLWIKRLKLDLPKGDFYSLLIFSLICLDALSLVFLRQLETGITAVLIAVVVLFVIHKEEKVANKPTVERKAGQVKTVDSPQL